MSFSVVSPLVLLGLGVSRKLRPTMDKAVSKLFGGSNNVLTTAPALSTSNVDSSHPHSRLIWMDLEMTGLNHDTDSIMEVGCMITNGNLEIIDKGIDIVIHHSNEALAKMNDWCKEHHTKSGLTEKCRQSPVSLEEAEAKLLAYLQEHTPKGVCPLAGNSVYMDRLFLIKYMPLVNSHMHYRIVDVSSVKELCRRWSPVAFSKAPRKALKHRSLDDLQDSISELKFYRKHFFKDQ